MLIWVLAIVLIVAFGALGYAKGAIRMVFPLVGLLVATLLALPLAPLVRPLVPMMGMENPIWSVLVPPLIVFFLVEIVFIAIGFLVHWKLGVFYKYRTDEHKFLGWLRLNQRVGVCMGVIAGCVYTLLIGIVVYVLGYPTIQASTGEGDPAAIRYLNQARLGLKESGLETAVAAFDPAPESYYQAADILGLLYHNPLLDGRLASYPPFLVLAERSEFQSIVNDAEYQNLLKGQATVDQIIAHPKTQEIIADQALIDELAQIDLPDLYAYLKTGESEKYRDQPILGRWEVDFYGTMIEEKKRRMRMTSSEMRQLRQEMELIRTMRLIVAPDGTVRLKGPDVSGLIRQIEEAATRPVRPVQVVRAPTPTTTLNTAQDSRMTERYGLARPAAPAPSPGFAPAPAQAASAAPAPTGPMSLDAVAEAVARLQANQLAQGTWKGLRTRYELTIKTSANVFFFGGDAAVGPAQGIIRDGKLYLTRNRETVVLERY